MKQRILELIDLYAEATDSQEKNSFGKNRQRAELLKQNEVFLTELAGIKNRLGEKFLKLVAEEIPEVAFESKESFKVHAYSYLSNSDFAEPKVVFSILVYDKLTGYPNGAVYYLPGTPFHSTVNWPVSLIQEEKDPYFDGLPLEWVNFSDYDERPSNINDHKFRLECKHYVFNRYLVKWNAFLEKWHISKKWNGDLDCLHAHSLPSVMVELDEKNQNLPIVIRLGAWATLGDIIKERPAIERMMREAHISRERESENFLRDLIWYRLNKESSMSPLVIARDWAKRFPREIDLEVVQKVVMNEVEFHGVPPGEALEEIMSDDPSMAELKGKFIAERKAFIDTKLSDRVKKQIRAFQKKIDRLGSKEWDRSHKSLLK